MTKGTATAVGPHRQTARRGGHAVIQGRGAESAFRAPRDTTAPHSRRQQSPGSPSTPIGGRWRGHGVADSRGGDAAAIWKQLAHAGVKELGIQPKGHRYQDGHREADDCTQASTSCAWVLVLTWEKMWVMMPCSSMI
jgi:hypothetical protein